MRIGPYPRISLKAARDLRAEQKRLLYEDGINPCDAKKRNKDQRWGKHAQLTFEAVALDWHTTKTAGTWTERHSDDVIKKLNKDIFPAIGGMAIDAITAQDCLAVLRSIEVDRQLAHIEKNKVTAAYNRAEYWLPQRVEMMQRWADLLDQVG